MTAPACVVEEGERRLDALAVVLLGTERVVEHGMVLPQPGEAGLHPVDETGHAGQVPGLSPKQRVGVQPRSRSCT